MLIAWLATHIKRRQDKLVSRFTVALHKVIRPVDPIRGASLAVHLNEFIMRIAFGTNELRLSH